MAIQRPRGFIGIMMYHWVVTFIWLATGAGLIQDWSEFHSIEKEGISLQPSLGVGMLGFGVWCSLCG